MFCFLFSVSCVLLGFVRTTGSLLGKTLFPPAVGGRIFSRKVRGTFNVPRTCCHYERREESPLPLQIMKIAGKSTITFIPLPWLESPSGHRDISLRSM